jgi:hypothetical protein
VGDTVAASSAEIRVDGSGSLGSKWARPRSPTFPDDVCDPHIEIHIIDAQAGQLRQSHSGIEEEPDNRRISAILKSRAVARLQQQAQLFPGEHGGWLFGHEWPFHVGHWRAEHFSLLDGPSKELLQVAETDLCRLGAEVLDLERHVGLDVLSGKELDVCGHPIVDEEQAEPFGGIGIALDGLGASIHGAER